MAEQVEQAGQQPPTQHFKTVEDMMALPLDKIDAFCEDLRLWLTMIALFKAADGVKLVDVDTFGWIDDGKHEPRARLIGADGTVLVEADFASVFAALGGDVPDDAPAGPEA